MVESASGAMSAPGPASALLLLAIVLPPVLAATAALLAKWLLDFLAAFNTGFDPANDDGAIAIVVPTGGVARTGDGVWGPNSQTVQRVRHAIALQSRCGLPVIIAGGVRNRAAPAEAALAAGHMNLAGMDVVLEDGPRSSAETGSAVAVLVAGNTRFQSHCTARPRVVLATHTRHIARMAACLRHCGLEVLVSPAQGDGMSADDGFFARASSCLRLSYRLLWEVLAIGWYLLLGRFRVSDLLDRSDLVQEGERAAASGGRVARATVRRR